MDLTLDPGTLKLHPVAELFPEMDDARFRELVDDIRDNGQIEPITVDSFRQIIDGRHRWKAAQELGIEVRTHNPYYANPKFDAQQFVISANLKRRHLTDSQRAMIAAKLANLSEGRPEKTAPNGAVSQAQAAEQLQTSRRAVQRAVTVQTKGTPELAAAVEQGRLPVSTAAQAAKKLTPEEQIEVLSKTPGKVGKAVRKVIEQVAQEKRDAEEWNELVDKTHEKLRPKDFDEKEERERVRVTHTLYRALQDITALPAPADVLPMIPEWCEGELKNVEPALKWLGEFRALYKEKINNETLETVA